MISKILISIFLSITHFFCRTVEISVPPQNIKLIVPNRTEPELSVYLSEGAGEFKKLKSENKYTYQIKSPRMDGGYSAFLFFRYNIHDPRDYEIIQIRNNEKILKKLSLIDIQKMEKNENGFSVVEIREK